MTQVQLTPNGTLEVSGDITVDTVMSLWPDYAKAINNLTSLSVDLKGVALFDTAGLAWLLEIKRTCETKKIEFSVSHVSDKIIALAKLSDVDTLLSINDYQA